MTRLYSKMCREAREIQELRPERSYFPITMVKVVVGGRGDRWYVDATSVRDYVHLVWLPWQEDLQEIFRMKNGNPDDYWILKSFLVWFSHLNECHNRDVSINWLWLRYVMETVYQKRWNGETWELIQ